MMKKLSTIQPFTVRLCRANAGERELAFAPRSPSVRSGLRTHYLQQLMQDARSVRPNRPIRLLKGKTR